MAKKRNDYSELAKDIVELVGGEANINSLAHCATRLRFKLKDESIAHTDALNERDDIVTVMQSGGQYQVVIGTHVSDVFAAIHAITNLGDKSSSEKDSNEEKGNLFGSFVGIITGVFGPVLGILAGSGMIKGLVTILMMFGVIEMGDGNYLMLWTIADTMNYFMPVVLGYTAAKKFDINPALGIVIGAALVNPAFTNLINGGAEPLYTIFGGTIFSTPIYFEFLGIPVLMMTYTQSVFPIIVAVYLASKINTIAKNYIPKVVQMFFVPVAVIFITVPVTLIVIGPIITFASNIVSNFMVSIYALSPTIAGLVMGGTWQVLVMFGLHWGLIPLVMGNVAALGFDPIMILTTATPIATIGAVLGVMIKTKNKKLKALCAPTFATGIFGISEPAIYGITLPNKLPFIFTLVGASIGGGIMGFLGTKTYQFGGMGLLAILNTANPAGIDMGFYGAIIGYATAFIVALVLTLLFWDDSKSPQKK